MRVSGRSAACAGVRSSLPTGLILVTLLAACGDGVGPTDMTGFRVTPASVSLRHPGDTIRLSAADVPGTLTWFTSDADVVQVTADGLATASGYGTATIAARAAGEEATARVDVRGDTSLLDLEGTWTTENVDAPAGVEPEGTLWLRKDQGALRGVWRGRRDGQPLEVVTLAMRTGAGWTMARADGARGRFAVMTGRIIPGRVELDSGSRLGSQSRERTVLSDFTMDQFLWTVEESEDGGEDWTPVWTQRVSRADRSFPPPVLDTLSETCTAPEYGDFDFWIGDWTVTVPSGGTAGSNRVHRIAGCGIQENWRDAGGGGGVSLNMYDPRSGSWTQFYAASTGGWIEIAGSLRAGRMVLEGTAGGARDRVTWSLLADGRVRQRWENAPPGAGFSTVFDGYYSRR